MHLSPFTIATRVRDSSLSGSGFLLPFLGGMLPGARLRKLHPRPRASSASLLLPLSSLELRGSKGADDLQREGPCIYRYKIPVSFDG